MICDRELSLFKLDPESPALPGTLLLHSEHLAAPMEVFYRRYFEAMQAGQTIDCMVRIPGHLEAEGELYVLYGGLFYRVEQLQLGADEHKLPCSTLSLSRTDRRFEIYKKE